MQIQYTGHKIEITPALREYADKKFQRLNRFADHVSNMHIIFDANKTRQSVEAIIKLHGSELNAKSEADDMYTAIDDLVDKIARQLTKHKEKHSEVR